MTVVELINDLEKYGVTVSLGINCKSDKKALPEAEELMRRLSDMRNEVIGHLTAERFVPLDDTVALPHEWGFNKKMKNYILDAPHEILGCIKVGHSALFGLLWCFKALCFIRNDKELYGQLEAAVRERYGFDFNEYNDTWHEFEQLRHNPQSSNMAQADIDRYERLRAKVIEMGAIP